MLSKFFKKRTKQKSQYSSTFHISGHDDKIMDINFDLEKKDLGLYLGKDYIILEDENKIQLLIHMLQKGLEHIEEHKK